MNTLIRYVFLLATAGLLVACGGSNKTTSSDISETVADAREAQHEIMDTNEKEEAFVDTFEAWEEEVSAVSDKVFDDPLGWLDEWIQSLEEVHSDVEALDALDNPEALTYCTLGGGECKDDENCAPSDDGYALVCRKAGSTPAGGRCKVHEDCAKGLACAIYWEDIGYCKPLCSDSIACPEGYQICMPWYGYGGKTAGLCFGSDCTPPDNGCASGDRCTVLANQVFDCLPAGPVPVGGDCSKEDCVAGAVCFQSDGQSICRAFCKEASDCKGQDDHCIFPWRFTDFGFCRDGCDPILQEGCKPGEACYFSDPTVGSTLCWQAGTLDEGEDCSDFVTFCKPGLDCILQPNTDPFEYYCRPYCDPAHPCPAGYKCSFPEASPVMGVCLPE